MQYISLAILIAGIGVGTMQAQEVDINKAIELALEKNYDVRSAILSREITDNQAEAGNAGYMPSVYIDGSGNYSLQNTEIQFPSPEQPSISADNAATINLAASGVVSYTLFNGGRRLYTYRNLQSQSEDGRLREKLAMERTSLTVVTRFLDLLRLNDAVSINSELVSLSNDRLQRAKENYGYGNFTRLQLLNAEVDLRTDSISLIESELRRTQALRDLNLAIGLPADTVYSIDSVFTFLPAIEKNTLLQGAKTKNSQYLQARNDVYGAEQLLNASKADRLPTLNLQGGYSYNFNKFEASFLDRQETYGLNAGLSLRFYLFDGGRMQRNIDNAQLSAQIAEVEQERRLNELIKLINNAYDSYTTSLALFNLSRRNLNLAEANFTRSRDAFNTGQITGIELRDAQINLAQARYEISIRRISAKLAETGLLFEAGVLLE